jgi:hypothetical protein
MCISVFVFEKKKLHGYLCVAHVDKKWVGHVNELDRVGEAVLPVFTQRL